MEGSERVQVSCQVLIGFGNPQIPVLASFVCCAGQAALMLPSVSTHLCIGFWV